MRKTIEPQEAAHRPVFVGALRALAAEDTRDTVKEGHDAAISAFVARDREAMAQLVMPTAALIIIIEGQKEIVAGSDHRVYQAGDAFVLPAQARFDVVNEPDPATGFYRALFVRFPRELVIEAARLWPQYVRQRANTDRLVASAALCSAVIHGAEALSGRIAASRRVIDHRILEILLILAEQGVLPLVPKYVDGSVVEAVRLLVRHRLHVAWIARDVAAELSLSEATLRRRLRAEGQTLQALLRAERMQAAWTVLADRDADVADALAATGYRSRSHFARHFQQLFGASPSSVRQRRRPASA